MVPNSPGPGELLMRFGTKEQKQYWLPRLADGREMPCFGLTFSARAETLPKNPVCRQHREFELRTATYRAFFSSRIEVSDAIAPLDLDARALDAALRNAFRAFGAMAAPCHREWRRGRSQTPASPP